MNVVPLHQAKPSEDVAAGLRTLADRIENGEIEWPVTTCVVMLGHTGAESNPDADGICWSQNHWDTYGYGPRTDVFTVRGLIASVTRNWGDS